MRIGNICPGTAAQAALIVTGSARATGAVSVAAMIAARNVLRIGSAPCFSCRHDRLTRGGLSIAASANRRWTIAMMAGTIRRHRVAQEVVVDAPELTIVVPTFNEHDNIVPLLGRLDAVLAGIAWEAIFVDDDTPDGTAQALREAARRDRRVRCIQRIGRRGLAGACIEGIL